MNDAEYEQQKARIQPLCDKWIKPLGLAWWDIELAYDRERDSAEPATVMKCKAMWRYMQAVITVFLPVCADCSDQELEFFFVHELGHIFLSECRQMKEDDWLDHEERVATTLAKAFTWLWQHVEAECANKVLDKAP